MRLRHPAPEIFLLLFAQALFIQAASAQVKLCAPCHAGIAKRYAATGMARSFYQPQSRETARYYHKPSDTWYAMEARAGGYFQRRWRIGYDGKETDVDESRVDYVMGSGNRVRTFLSRTQNGALVELPVAWYAENGGTWAMNPGHDRDYSLSRRTIAYECMGCHNSYPNIPAGHDEAGAEPLYAGALPEGIDCTRCHGPGGNHIRMAGTEGAKAEEIRGAIVNPARLNKDRQMEICYQCHLETTSLQLPHSIRRFDRGPFSYKPGEPLGDFAIFFDHAKGSAYDDDFEIAGASAWRLRKSKCFLASKGAMTCTTCHDPHGGKADYNAVCGGCHAPAALKATHPASPDCVACHMPKRRTQDVVHAVMTDHRIGIFPPGRDLLAMIPERREFDDRQYRGEVVPYYPSPLPPTPENVLYSAVAQVTQKSNMRAGLPRLASEVARQRPAQPGFWLELGEAWLAAGNRKEAVAAFEQAVRREPDSPVALLDLADALTEAGSAARALEVLRHGVQVAPGDALLWYETGLAQTRLGRDAEAAAAFGKSDLPEARNLLGEALAGEGQMERAEAAFRGAIQSNPDFPDAQGNLAHLLAARGDLPQAAWYFARAVKLKPADAGIRVNYGVTLAGLNRFAEARVQLEAAVKADPKSADAHNFLGDLLARAGHADNALREFLEAARLRPAFGLAHLNAAGVLSAKGNTARARAEWELAAKDADPATRARALQALRR